jgi:hypothetical protein
MLACLRESARERRVVSIDSSRIDTVSRVILRDVELIGRILSERGYPFDPDHRGSMTYTEASRCTARYNGQ